MRIGVPKEIRESEFRVGLTPAGVRTLCGGGHRVLVEAGAGEGSGFSDAEYAEQGAEIVGSAADVWELADLVVKVKEPLPPEYGYFRDGLVLFTFLHLAADPALARELAARGVTAIAYETIRLPDGSLPLLTPMSVVAGRLAVQEGARFLESFHGGRGVLLGGVPGVPPADVFILGGGAVGASAARIAVGMGARVTVIEKNPDRMRYLEDVFHGRVATLMSNPHHIAQAVRKADLLIGAVLVPGARAPKLVTEEMVKTMKKGAVIVDVAVDQGGSIETIDRATTHRDPVYVRHGVIHYAVANMPGAVPRTSTLALTNATLPYVQEIAGKGLARALQDNVPLRGGVNVTGGFVTHPAVAEAVNLPWRPLEELPLIFPVRAT